MQPAHFAHGYFGDVPSTFHQVATNPHSNDVSTTDTIRRMYQLAISQSISPVVQSAIANALMGTDPRSSAKAKANAIFHYIKSSVKFVEDEQILAEVFGVDTDKELLITPERLLTMPIPAGDCDDFSTLAASMLIGLGDGIGISFCTIAAERNDPDRFSHVYVVCYFPLNERVVFDSSHGSYLGWETNDIYRIQEWLVMPMANVRKGLHGIAGLGQYSGEPIMDFSTGMPMDVGSVGGGLNLTSILVNGINTGIQTTSRILESKYGGVQPGTYQRTAEGGVTYRLPSSSTNVGFSTMPDLGVGGGTITWVLIGVAAFGVIMLMTSRRGKG